MLAAREASATASPGRVDVQARRGPAIRTPGERRQPRRAGVICDRDCDRHAVRRPNGRCGVARERYDAPWLPSTRRRRASADRGAGRSWWRGARPATRLVCAGRFANLEIDMPTWCGRPRGVSSLATSIRRARPVRDDARARAPRAGHLDAERRRTPPELRGGRQQSAQRSCRSCSPGCDASLGRSARASAVADGPERRP